MSQSITEGNQGRNLMQELWRKAACWLVLWLFYSCRSPAQGWWHPLRTRPFPVWIKSQTMPDQAGKDNLHVDGLFSRWRSACVCLPRWHQNPDSKVFRCLLKSSDSPGIFLPSVLLWLLGHPATGSQPPQYTDSHDCLPRPFVQAAIINPLLLYSHVICYYPLEMPDEYALLRVPSYCTLIDLLLTAMLSFSWPVTLPLSVTVK